MAPPIRDLARVGGLTRAVLYDGLTVTAKARQTFADSFAAGHSCKVCPEIVIDPDLALVERQRRGAALRKLHFARLSMASRRKADSDG